MAKTESTGKVKKFTYEVKDFEPNYKKNPLGKLIGVLVCLAVFTLVFLVIFFASKGGKKRELTPEETVKEAISDCFSRLAGEKSPLIKGLGLEDYIKLLKGGRFGYRADLRLKEIKDFGLGFEEYASGVGVSFDGEADIKNHLVNGNISGSWTVVSLNLLQYVYDSEIFALSSDDFFKETITLTPSDVLAFMTFGDSLRKNLSEMKAEKTGERKDFTVGGKEKACDAYKIRFDIKNLKDPVEMTAYIDREGRLVQLGATYDNEARISFLLELSGKDHPADQLKFSFDSQVKEVKVNGNLEISNEYSSSGFDSTISGELNINKLKLSADVKLGVNYSDKSFTLDFSGNDEVTEANVTASGKFVPDKKNIKMKFDNMEIGYGGEKIATAGMTLTIKGDTEGEVDVTYPKVRVIDLKDFTKQNFEEIREQVMKRVDEYMEIFKKFI